MVKMTCAPEPDENLKKAISRTRESARAGASIVCLPELFRSQYFCQGEDAALFDLAEPVPGPTTDALTKVDRKSTRLNSSHGYISYAVFCLKKKKKKKTQVVDDEERSYNVDEEKKSISMCQSN